MKEESKPSLDEHDFSHRSWSQKFRVALGGLMKGIQGRGGRAELNSFWIHIPVAVVVIVAGGLLGVGWISMTLLLLCIGLVWTVELLNTSLESLARAVTDQPNQDVKAALDIAAGAVLAASSTAVVVGLIVFGTRVAELWRG